MKEAPRKLCAPCEPFGECLFEREAKRILKMHFQINTSNPKSSLAESFKAALKARQTEAYPNCPNESQIRKLTISKAHRRTSKF
mgnify:CR=1 FL=1